MKALVHFFISKFKQDSLELAVILAINLFFMALLAFVAGPQKLDAQTFQVFIYFNCYVAVFLDLMSFGQKYYLSLPVNRQHILFNLAFAKLVNFIPCFVIFTLGYSTFPKSDVFNSGYFPTMLMFVVLAFIINLYTLQYDITKPRIEHSKKKLMYFLVMIKILINYIFFSSLLAFVGGLLYYKGWHEYVSQWHLIVLITVFAGMKFFNLLKILLDEKTTYWFWKRDGILSGLKLSVVVVPFLIYTVFFNDNKIYEGNELALIIKAENHSKLQLLLEKGVDPNKANEYGLTPLFASIISGDLTSFDILLEKGARVDRTDVINAGFSKFSNHKSLDLAVAVGNVEIIKKLVDLKMAHTNEKGTNALHMMAKACKAPGIFDVLRSGADINATDKAGKTPLMYAVKQGCWPVTLALVQNGADLLTEDKKGNTVFDLASANRNMKWFLEDHGPWRSPFEHERSPASVSKDR